MPQSLRERKAVCQQEKRSPNLWICTCKGYTYYIRTGCNQVQQLSAQLLGSWIRSPSSMWLYISFWHQQGLGGSVPWPYFSDIQFQTRHYCPWELFCLSALVFLLCKMVIICLVSKDLLFKNWFSSFAEAFLSCLEKLDNLYLHAIDKLSTIPIKLFYWAIKLTCIVTSPREL